MKNLIPDFHVRYAFKSIKIGSLYIKHSKPEIPKLDNCNLIYHFKCPCSKSYVGRTKRVLRIRAEEHRTFSRAKKTYYHIHKCPIYVKKLIEYEKVHLPPRSGSHFRTKVRDHFFMDHFKILQKKTLKPTPNYAKPNRTLSEYIGLFWMIKKIIKVLHYFNSGPKIFNFSSPTQNNVC